MPKRFLIIDDSKTFREIMREVVQSLGHVMVGEAADGIEGIEKFKQLRPDVTLLDIEMPRMAGVETLKGILAEDPDAAIIMLTKVDDIAVVDECILAGARDYVVKDRLLQAAERIAAAIPVAS